MKRSPYPPWRDLFADLLSLILSHLKFADYVRFGAVCKRWRSIVADSDHLRALRCPWLAILDSSVLFSPIEMKQIQIQIPFVSDSSNYFFVGSSEGCLIFFHHSEGSGLLFNPFTSQTIHLPPSNYLEEWGGSEKVVLSSSPFSSGGGDCVMAALWDVPGLVSRRLTDRGWLLLYTEQQQEFEDCVDLVFFRGLLYCLTCHCNVLVFDFSRGPRTETFLELNDVRMLQINGSEDPCMYLVESAGKLLLVLHYSAFDDGKNMYRTIRFEVYQIDLSTEGWVELGSLGDQFLLFGELCFLSVDAVDFFASGFRPNCIYFTDCELEADEHQWRVFSLEDKKIQPFSPPCSCSVEYPLIWIKPQAC